MERNFYNEEFEHFLKQKADQHKMYPADRVWRGVYHSLHSRRRWYILGLLILLVSGGLVSRELVLSGYKDVAREINGSLQNTISFTSSLSSGNTTGSNGSVPATLPAYLKGAKPSSVQTSNQFPSAINSRIGITVNGPSSENNSTPTSELKPSIIENNATETNTEVATPEINAENASPEIVKPEVKETEKKKIKSLSAYEYQNQKAIAEIRAKQKWSLQLYASPIVSYRKLTNLNRSNQYVPVAINYAADLDNYVQHKPALGFELGTKMQFHASKSLKLYIGGQLNYSRYTIEAYNYNKERATITLSSARTTDTISNFTSLRNFGGFYGEQLQNQYLQMSIPIGGELRLLGRKRLQLSISGSIQPTYLITSDAYLISTDYKNYVQDASLARKWNIHTNVEAFVSYKMGSLKWQFGPQFRYQVLSSYSDKYPIREYLTEYGIKLGISKTIK
ncbi:MAG: hypothetical protein H7Y27_04855 [Gemmatimonadaceae bacterium]|nr:hypothetical protein [Chitinophagaceae bacterium]